MAFVVNSYPFGSLLTSAKMGSMQANDDFVKNSPESVGLWSESGAILTANRGVSSYIVPFMLPASATGIGYLAFLETMSSGGAQTSSFFFALDGVSNPHNLAVTNPLVSDWAVGSLSVNSGGGLRASSEGADHLGLLSGLQAGFDNSVGNLAFRSIISNIIIFTI